MLWKWLKWIAIFLLSIVLLLNIIFYFLQENIIFLDTQLDHNHQFYFSYPYEEMYLKATDGAILHGLHFKPGKPKGVIFYTHGNAGDVERWGNVVIPFVEKGYHVIVWDYRGYGKSYGTRSEATLYSDAQLFYDVVKSYFPEEEITVYGRSLGTGIATKTAANNNPKQLILETPYYGLKDMAKSKYAFLWTSQLLQYRIPTYQYVQDVNCPITLFHGTDDETINYESAKALAKSAEQLTSRFVTIENGKHNNLEKFDAYWEVINEILP